MAKGARASSRKANNARLKSKVFGPVEAARTERLAAKLLELASQPRPKTQGKSPSDDVDMDAEDSDLPAKQTADSEAQEKDNEAMDLDQGAAASKPRTKLQPSKGRIEKKGNNSRRRAAIVFPTYKNKPKAKVSRQNKNK